MPTFGFRLDPRQDESRSGAGHESRSRHGPVRRITGYHNAFDDEEPPDYHDDHPLSDFKLPIPNLPHIDPPKYSCTTFIEGVLEMRLERISPFDSVKDSQWDKVHVRLQGTMLEIHQAKTFGLFTPASKRGNVTGSPGRLLKRYTMQHAEVVGQVHLGLSTLAPPAYPDHIGVAGRSLLLPDPVIAHVQRLTIDCRASLLIFGRRRLCVVLPSPTSYQKVLCDSSWSPSQVNSILCTTTSPASDSKAARSSCASNLLTSAPTGCYSYAQRSILHHH